MLAKKQRNAVVRRYRDIAFGYTERIMGLRGSKSLLSILSFFFFPRSANYGKLHLVHHLTQLINT